MILDKKIEVHVTSRNYKHYIEKGYNCKCNSTIIVDCYDLPLRARQKVHVKCDYCEQEKYIRYSDYMIQTKNFNRPYSCNSTECMNKQRSDAFQEKYGVSNPNKLYEVRNKINQTCLEKYGYSNPFSAPEIIQKIHDTNVLKYGVPNPMQNLSVKEKASNTCFEKYGVYNPTQSLDILKKALLTACDHNNIRTSKQQNYLNKLYNGILNYPLGVYPLDIFLPAYNLDIEYNGSGHWLNVVFGNMTQEEFENKELKRGYYIRSHGVNQMIIISRKDKLPSDMLLLKMLNDTISFLQGSNHHWQKYDIDNNSCENATGKKPYDFGELCYITSDHSLTTF